MKSFSFPYLSILGIKKISFQNKHIDNKPCSNVEIFALPRNQNKASFFPIDKIYIFNYSRETMQMQPLDAELNTLEECFEDESWKQDS